jgi:hypothetical protein
MTWHLLFVSLLVGTILAEIIFRTIYGSWFHAQLREIAELIQAFRKAEGDDVRQKLLLISGRSILQFNLTILGLIVGLIAIAGLAPCVLSWNVSQQTAYLVALSIVATGWWTLRLRRRITSLELQQSHHTHLIVPYHTYGRLERLLHWIALEPASVRHLAFELERQFALPKHSVHPSSSNNDADGAIYVCGLARSGTTMLLRLLCEIDAFRSLSYRDMPFVLAPNIWRQITRHSKRRSVLVERAHGDGILVNFDSPEGFEEVFWRTFCPQTYGTCCLNTDEPSQDVLSAFADYRALVANPRTGLLPSNGMQKRYLSKNNNNLLRLNTLSADPTATILLVYRNPVATARSLHRQHQRFCAAQIEDRFTQTYMGWLAHHEFGLDHRPFGFAMPMMDISFTPEDPNYWLDYWNAVHSHILTQMNLRLYLVNHDVLRAAPLATINKLLAVLKIQADPAPLAQQVSDPDLDQASTYHFNPALLQRAEAIYQALLVCPNNLFDPSRTKNE